MRTFKRVFVIVCSAALVSGLAGASATAKPAPGKEACKNGGHEELGFANQGECVKAANEAARNGEPFPPEENGGPFPS